MFNQKRFEELVNEWYNYKDFCCKENADEYYELKKERELFLISCKRKY
jgi:hypothetical protein